VVPSEPGWELPLAQVDLISRDPVPVVHVELAAPLEGERVWFPARAKPSRAAMRRR
jgi:hypothetical protein